MRSLPITLPVAPIAAADEQHDEKNKKQNGIHLRHLSGNGSNGSQRYGSIVSRHFPFDITLAHGLPFRALSASAARDSAQQQAASGPSGRVM